MQEVVCHFVVGVSVCLWCVCRFFKGDHRSPLHFCYYRGSLKLDQIYSFPSTLLITLAFEIEYRMRIHITGDESQDRVLLNCIPSRDLHFYITQLEVLIMIQTQIRGLCLNIVEMSPLTTSCIFM